MVVLHEVDVDPNRGKRLFVVRLGKEAAPVSVLPGTQHPDIRDIQTFNVH